MSKHFYRFYCEICNWNLVTDGADPPLHEIKTSPVPGGLPKINPEDKKITTPKSKTRLRKFRCPQCGRVVTAKKIENPQEKIEQYQDEVVSEQRRKEWEMIDAKAKERYERIKREYEKEKQQDIFI
jgi:hypothetical protein